ncbi:HoxN/HupN/NixA family nickel/cobalt transporter [Gordonia sp. FQ]|uniref:HoxN/HupN/NixA family nickel/cobalt transporter n=1 Tax=Gordonia sp. FQ TaxID=3446634 RepID=UPI003F879D44
MRHDERRDVGLRLSGWPVAAAVIIGLNLLGWGLLLLVVAPAGVHYSAGGGAALAVGLGAYVLGMRHAFDADHIAAIDNTTRRLVGRGRPASTVGLWFSLGHSSVVVLLCAALAAGIGAAARAVASDDSGVHAFSGVWGPAVSSLFLLLIAGINLWSLRRARRARATGDAAAQGGPMWWVLRRFETLIDRPSRMFGVGFAFGLGFDTATEIGLLALAGTATVGKVPWWAVMTLPILFAAGMSLLDTVQGAVMRRAYAWSPGAAPDRRVIPYALIMTGISALVAIAVAVVQLAGIGADAFGWGGVVAAVGSADLETLGLWLTGILLSLWALVAAAVLLRRGAVDPES